MCSDFNSLSTLMPTQTAIFGGGCFWCTEAVFQMLRGVSSVASGYAGGSTENPTYEQVSSGRTGHAEVIKIEFDPSQIAYKELLTVFFATHDPTTPNRQGNDVGTQYRSIVLYTNEEQRSDAEQYIAELQKDFGKTRVVTEIEPLDTFYDAEDYHKEYYLRNQMNPYCQALINPKLTKVKEKFKALLKKNSAK